MKFVIYGGQYGSEGKGSAAEWLLKHGRHVDEPSRPKYDPDRKLVAIGENSPNSGHTCSLGKTRNIPASSFFAESVVLGPDSAVNIPVLMQDLDSIKTATGKVPRLYIHEHAALVGEYDGKLEFTDGMVERVSSTGSGSGAARAYRKCYLRRADAAIGNNKHLVEKANIGGYEIVLLNRFQFIHLLEQLRNCDCVFECSQGTLLDVNWGIYPFVTSRTTLPRVSIERNGLATLPWEYFGVFRTYPIRTGGPSGPTGAPETSFADIKVPDEIASVTKRIRRVFGFSRDDFWLSMNLTRPAHVMFTHLDYIDCDPGDLTGFVNWFWHVCDGKVNYRVEGLYLSDEIGNFVNHGAVQL